MPVMPPSSVTCPQCLKPSADFRPMASQILGKRSFSCTSCGHVWFLEDPSRRRLPTGLISTLPACPQCFMAEATELRVTGARSATYYRCERCGHVWMVPHAVPASA